MVEGRQWRDECGEWKWTTMSKKKKKRKTKKKKKNDVYEGDDEDDGNADQQANQGERESSRHRD